MPASAAGRLSLSPRAIRDIVAIEAHYAQFSLVTADRVIADIKASADRALLNPLIGVEGIRRGTRHIVLRRYPYTIIYRVHRNVIQVVRVLHQRREYFNPPPGGGLR